MGKRKYTEGIKKSNRNWDAANLDRMSLALPKGSKDTIKAHAEAHNESVNGFIGRAISETMERDTSQKPTGTPTEAAAALEGILSSDTLKAAQTATEATGESVSSFIIRVVTEAGVDALEAARDIAEMAGKDVTTFTNRTIMEAVKNIESTRKADV